MALLIAVALLSVIANACTSIGAIADNSDFLNDNPSSTSSIDHNVLYITIAGVVTLLIVQCFMFLQAFFAARLQSSRKIKISSSSQFSKAAAYYASNNNNEQTAVSNEEAALNRHNEEHENLDALQQDHQWINVPNFGNVVCIVYMANFHAY